MEEALQLILVTTPSWESMQGEMSQYERASQHEEWTLRKPPTPVVIGKNGMAWGMGLHSTPTKNLKREGDGKTPAGIFSIGPAFGLNRFSTKLEFILLSPHIEAVDDPASRYYNQIVNREAIPEIDWTSSEKMGSIDLYEMGFVVHHNFKDRIPGAGSAIFFHLWNEEKSGTAGCTAMSREDLSDLLQWLDPQKKPILIQEPIRTNLSMDLPTIFAPNRRFSFGPY